MSQGIAMTAAADQKRRQLVRNAIIGGNASDADVDFFIAVADHLGVNPLLGHIYIIQGKVYPTRDGLIYLAHQSGQFNGIEVLREEWTEQFGWVVSVAVHRKGVQYPFTSTAYQSEFQNQKSPVWREKPRLMTLKCAESLALRKAFPVMGGATTEEMGMQIELDGEGRAQIIETTVEPLPEPRKPKDWSDEELADYATDMLRDDTRRLAAASLLFGRCQDYETLQHTYGLLAIACNRGEEFFYSTFAKHEARFAPENTTEGVVDGEVVEEADDEGS